MTLMGIQDYKDKTSFKNYTSRPVGIKGFQQTIKF